MGAAKRERRSLRRATWTLWIAWLWHAAAALHAQPSPRAGLGLNWVRLEGAESCVSSIELMNRVEERANRVLFVRTGEAVLTLDGYVRPVSEAAPSHAAQAAPSSASRSWAVVLEVSDAEGQVLGRRDLGVLAGDDCEVVTRAAALIFDLTLDPEGTLGTGIPLAPETQRLLDELLRGEPAQLDPATLPKATVQPSSAPAEPAKPAPRQVEPPRELAPESERAGVGLAGVAAQGAMPSFAPGVALHVHVPTRAGWVVELGLLTLAEQSVQSQPRYGGEASFGLQSASLVLCPSRMFSLLLACAGAEYGRQSVSVSGFRSVRTTPSRDLVNFVAQGTLQLDVLAWLYVRASAALIVPLLRHDYVYDAREGDQRLFRPAVVAGRGELGLGLRM